MSHGEKRLKKQRKSVKNFIFRLKGQQNNNQVEDSEIAFTFVVVLRFLLLTQWPNFGSAYLFVCRPPDF